jgi:Asp-tRNA(Asn)/Glu-tRNA(Gln) amidotransferase A subunit family amidase
MDTLAKLYYVMSGTEPFEAPPIRRIGIPSAWVSGAPGEPSLPYWFGRLRDDLTGLGYELVGINNDWLLPWGRIQELAGYEAARVHQQFRQEGKRYGPEVSLRLDAADKVTGAEYAAAHRWRAGLVEAFASAFTNVGLLITPAVAARRKVIGDDHINGVAYRPVLSWFSALVNHAGNPAIAIPILTETEPDIPPHSLQAIAPWWEEERLLAFARRLEHEGLAGFRRPPIGAG